MRLASSATLVALLLWLTVMSGCVRPPPDLDVAAIETAPAALTSSTLPLAPPGDACYVGPTACRKCHAEQYDGWQRSAHSHSHETLVEKGRLGSPECLRCHATGFGEAGGFVDSQTTPGMAAVTCEACHGPGSRHVQARESNQEDEPEYGKVGCPDCQHARICILCHRQPGFDAKSAVENHRHH
ncbi:MAG: cytochrome c family protein [Candidatus Coatesbacteria bacterium]|nr:cytochrome c family protein [Candidatus Coatesbacteria bacterium]